MNDRRVWQKQSTKYTYRDVPPRPVVRRDPPGDDAQRDAHHEVRRPEQPEQVVEQHPLHAVVVLNVVPAAVLDAALESGVEDGVLAAGGGVAGGHFDGARAEEVAVAGPGGSRKVQGKRAEH